MNKIIKFIIRLLPNKILESVSFYASAEQMTRLMIKDELKSR